jgi:hypothetical protein
VPIEHSSAAALFAAHTESVGKETRKETVLLLFDIGRRRNREKEGQKEGEERK